MRQKDEHMCCGGSCDLVLCSIANIHSLSEKETQVHQEKGRYLHRYHRFLGTPYLSRTS